MTNETDRSEAVAHFERVLAMIDGPDSHRRTVAAIVAFVNTYRATILAALRPEREEPGLRAAMVEAMNLVETGENRAMAADGPVPHFRGELDDREWRRLWVALSKVRMALAGPGVALPRPCGYCGSVNGETPVHSPTVRAALGAVPAEETPPGLSSLVETWAKWEPPAGGDSSPKQAAEHARDVIVSSLRAALQGSDRDSRPSLDDPAVECQHPYDGLAHSGCRGETCVLLREESREREATRAR